MMRLGLVNTCMDIYCGGVVTYFLLLEISVASMRTLIFYLSYSVVQHILPAIEFLNSRVFCMSADKNTETTKFSDIIEIFNN